MATLLSPGHTDRTAPGLTVYPEQVPAAAHPATLALLLHWGLPRQASAFAPALDQYLYLNLVLILGLAVLAHLLLLAGMLLRRDPADAQLSRRRVLRLETLPLAAFTLLFFALAFRAERLWARARYTGASMDALQVEVTGMQFAWYFRYPGPDGTFGRTDPTLIDAAAANPLGLDPTDPHGKDDIVTSELVLPSGREVSLALRALDVIHGFALPEMRVKQNAVPGATQYLHLTPTTPGTYAVMCTQVCGLGHFRMNANLRVLPPADFTTWLHTREHQP